MNLVDIAPFTDIDIVLSTTLLVTNYFSYL